MVALLRLTHTGWAYVLVVTLVAALGFVTGSTALILAAVVLALPAGVVALPAFYVVFGLLALVPGANPDTATGTATCTPSGACRAWTSGDPAAWFLVTTEVLGVLALAVAALLNVVLLNLILRARRASPPASPPTLSP
jgi:hypothetical protein